MRSHVREMKQNSAERNRRGKVFRNAVQLLMEAKGEGPTQMRNPKNGGWPTGRRGKMRQVFHQNRDRLLKGSKKVQKVQLSSTEPILLRSSARRRSLGIGGQKERCNSEQNWHGARGTVGGGGQGGIWGQEKVVKNWMFKFS